MLQKLTDRFERGRNKPWEFELTDDLADPSALANAIIGLKIVPERIEAKFKLSQNRSKDDQEGVISGLGEQGDEMSLGVSSLMKGFQS